MCIFFCKNGICILLRCGHLTFCSFNLNHITHVDTFTFEKVMKFFLKIFGNILEIFFSKIIVLMSNENFWPLKKKFHFISLDWILWGYTLIHLNKGDNLSNVHISAIHKYHFYSQKTSLRWSFKPTVSGKATWKTLYSNIKLLIILCIHIANINLVGIYTGVWLNLITCYISLSSSVVQTSNKV